MSNLQIKIRKVYIPFLMLSLGTILLYNLLRWALDIKLGILPLKDDLLNLWLPMLVAGIPVLTGMRRRFLILSVKEDNHRSYKLVMAAVIALSIMASQEYLLSNSYDLIK